MSGIYYLAPKDCNGGLNVSKLNHTLTRTLDKVWEGGNHTRIAGFLGLEEG